MNRPGLKACASALVVSVLGATLTGCTGKTPTQAPSDNESVATYGGGLAGGSITGPAWDRAVAKAQRDTAIVHNSGCSFRATGSAVAIDTDALVTNRHVVSGARSLSIESTGGQKASVRSWSIAESDDLAVLHLSRPLFPDPIQISHRRMTPGDLLVVMGYPLGGPFTVGRGRVTDLRGHGDDEMIEASVDILPGNSGGPLVDTKGNLAGLVRAIDLENGAALAIPADRVSALMASGGTPGAPCDH